MEKGRDREEKLCDSLHMYVEKKRDLKPSSTNNTTSIIRTILLLGEKFIHHALCTLPVVQTMLFSSLAPVTSSHTTVFVGKV